MFLPQRVALLLPSLVGGGAERSARFVGIALERAGYAVDMVVAVRKGELTDDPWVQAHLVDLKARNELLALPAYLRYLDRARPGLVISFVHSANLVSGLGGALRPATPFIVSVRNSLIKQPRDQWWVRRAFGMRPERRLYARARFVQTISDEVADQCRTLLGVPEERLRITYNSALDPGDVAATTPSPQDGPEAAALRPFFLSVGRLVPIKGFDTLIRALAQAAPRLPAGWRLAIVGDGPERAALERLAAECGVAGRVVFAGYRRHAGAWFAQAGGFCFASRGEAFGRVLHEALLARLPVVAASGPGVNEVLGHGRMGRLVNAGDVDAFAAAMVEIATGTFPMPAAADLDEHLRRYDPEAVSARYVAMVKEAIGTP